MGKNVHPEDRSISADEYETLSADERRASCRYPVPELPALIGWWVEKGALMEPPRLLTPALALVEAELLPVPAAETPPRPKSFDSATYSAIMGRGLLGRRRGPLAGAPVPGGGPENPRSAHVRVDSAEAAPAAPLIEPPPSAQAAESRIPAPPRESLESAEEEPAAVLRTCGALMLDLSHTGALFLSEAPPPAHKPLWVRLEGPVASEWLETRLVAITSHQPGSYLVRVAFRDSCPYDFFKQVVYGGGPASIAP
jgi:hypothetical protein